MTDPPKAHIMIWCPRSLLCLVLILSLAACSPRPGVSPLTPVPTSSTPLPGTTRSSTYTAMPVVTGTPPSMSTSGSNFAATQTPTPAPSAIRARLKTGPDPGLGCLYMMAAGPSLAWAPQDETLAFAVANAGIWLASAPDFAPRQLSGQGLQPEWLPTGQLAILSNVPERGSEWILQAGDPAGAWPTSAIELGPQKSLFINQALDGDRLALTLHRGNSVEDLVAVTISQAATRTLVSTEDGSLSTRPGGAYHWSPDHQVIAVERPKGGLPGQMSLLRAASGDEQLLSPNDPASTQRFETWAPSSTQLLYEQWSGSNAPLVQAAPDLFAWNVATANSRKLLPHVWGASWSSTNQIAFLLLGRPVQDSQGHITDTDFQPGQPFSLFLGIMDAIGLDVTALLPLGQVTDLDAFVSGAAFAPPDGAALCGTPRPAWSPDGSRLVFGDSAGRLWLISPGKPERLEIPTAQHVAWSAHSKWLALRTVDEVLILCAEPARC